jgi:hypothetical protein
MTKEEKREPNDRGLDRILRAAVKREFPINILCWGNVDAGTPRRAVGRRFGLSGRLSTWVIIDERFTPSPFKLGACPAP